MAIERLDTATLEALCGVLGDTGGGLTGSEIGGLLRQCQIDDVAPGITKRHRLQQEAARHLLTTLRGLPVLGSLSERRSARIPPTCAANIAPRPRRVCGERR